MSLDGCAPSQVFAELDRLDGYPRWMRLVHHVEPLGDDAEGRPAWNVELRAKVGPFTRSKRLRMVRTVRVPHESLRFERVEETDADKSVWMLGVDIAPEGLGSHLTMHLAYGGELWNSRVLNRILDHEVDRGRDGLRAVLVRSE